MTDKITPASQPHPNCSTTLGPKGCYRVRCNLGGKCIAETETPSPARSDKEAERAGQQFYGKAITADDIASFDELAREVEAERAGQAQESAPSSETIDTPEFSALLAAYRAAPGRNAPAHASLVAHIDARIAALRAAPASREVISLGDLGLLQSEERMTGERGWLLYDNTGKLVRALKFMECELVTRAWQHGWMEGMGDYEKIMSGKHETCGACEGTGYYAPGLPDECEECKGNGEIPVSGRE